MSGAGAGSPALRGVTNEITDKTFSLLGFDDEDAFAPERERPPQPLNTLVDTTQDELADAIAAATLIAPGQASHPGGRSMTKLPDNTWVSTRFIIRKLCGDKGGTGATSNARTMRVKLLSTGQAAGGGGGGMAHEPDLSTVIFPRSIVLAPFLVRDALLANVVGPAVVLGVARVEDFVVSMPDGTQQRPEYLLPEQVPQTLFRITFLQLTHTLGTCALPMPSSDDEEEEEVSILPHGADDDASEGGAAAAADAGEADEGGAAAAADAGEADEAGAEEEATGFFASPYVYTKPVYVKGGVVLANTAPHSRGPFTVTSLSEEDVGTAKEYFGGRLAPMSQRELLNMSPCFDAALVSPDAMERWHIPDVTLRARAAAVPEPCRWPGCKDARFADKMFGVGRSFGMFKHLNLHAALAAASPASLEPAALIHAANACGLCGSSSAGCTLMGVTKRGHSHAVVSCHTPPFCDKSPSFKPSKAKAGKVKNVPVSCKRCDDWVWLFSLRSHCALRHGDIELPPHAVTEAGIEALKSADRVKVAKPVTDAATREQRRRAQAARKERAAAAGASPPAAKRSRTAAVSSGAAAAGGASSASAAAAAGADGGNDGGVEEEQEEEEEIEVEEIEVEEDEGAGEDGDDSEGESDEEEDTAPSGAATVLPKFNEGDKVTHMGVQAIVVEVILGNEATGGLPMYVLRFTDHKGGVIEAEHFESGVSAAPVGARPRTTWKERSARMG